MHGKNKEAFAKQKIQKLIELYGDINDYSLSVYTSYDKKIIIRHKETGLCYEQSYQSHFKGIESSKNIDYAFIKYIVKCYKKYNYRYHYSNYINYNSVVTIYESEEDVEFIMNAQHHYEYDNNNGKPFECLRDFEVFKKKANLIHNHAYEYLEYDWKSRKVTYRNKKTLRVYTQLLHEHVSGSITIQEHVDNKYDEFITQANIIHNNEYEYLDYVDTNTPLTVVNKITGLRYTQRTKDILAGCKPRFENRRYASLEEFQIDSNLAHDGRFTVLEFKDVSSTIKIKDNQTGLEYYQLGYSHLSSLPKEISYSNVSRYEVKAIKLIEQTFPNCKVQSSYKPKWLNRKELDVYIPDLKIAIEFNGSAYHHSSDLKVRNFLSKTKKPENYHLNKCIRCQENGIKLIHIFDYEYTKKDFDLIKVINFYLNNEVTYKQSEKIYVDLKTLQLTNECDTSLVIYKPIPIFLTNSYA